MTVNEYDVKNWAKAHMGSGSCMHEFLHAIRRHWDIPDEELIRRAKVRNAEAGSFRGVSADWLVRELIPKMFCNRENLLRIMRWVNSPSDKEPMTFVVRAEREVGVCFRGDGRSEPCRKVVFCFHKGEFLMPYLASFYPVPDNYQARNLSNRYKTPKGSKK